jgi:hypothetical protein
MATTYLRIACFAATNCQYDNVLEAYGRMGDEILKRHGMALHDRYGPGPLAADEIRWNDSVIFSEGGPGALRQKCHERWPDGKGVPVIVCNLGIYAAYGYTIKPSMLDENDGVQWLPYVLINAQVLNAAGSTLIHELIHTTGLSAADHDGDPSSVFYEPRSNRSGQAHRVLFDRHAKRLRGMYYAEKGA